MNNEKTTEKTSGNEPVWIAFFPAWGRVPMPDQKIFDEPITKRKEIALERFANREAAQARIAQLLSKRLTKAYLFYFLSERQFALAKGKDREAIFSILTDEQKKEAKAIAPCYGGAEII